MIAKLLIANRGEIAVRVIRTARRMGVRTVAVYSEADAGAMHVAMADEAYAIGPAPARDSYLSIPNILDAAKRSGADAIHPGYGFLSENAEFAEACAAAGVIFVGPPPSAIRAMGSKSAAKALMERAGIPLTPGYHGEAQDLPTLAREAERIGFPVLVKASAGGGGKGMRVVERAEDLEAGVSSAKREAAASFGDDQVLIEKYLTRPRHIEVQVFADSHGQVVTLFERDCSIQRRHQKVIEEAPAPNLDPARRRTLAETAQAAARAIGYVGAGTVEFIAEDEHLYFMEMNTRLQVEHPVTEMITGQDLVEWQLRVAAGEPLPLSQDQLRIDGHAIEARIYAEDPARDFAPSIGQLSWLRAPVEGPHVRVDTGVREGDAVSIHYDPMIAKLVVWDRDRAGAAARLSAALADFEVAGVRTNVSFLKAIADHPAFRSAELDTGFIGRHSAGLQPPVGGAPDAALAAAVMRVLIARRAPVQSQARRSADPWSPWASADSWRANGEGWQEVVLQEGETRHRIPARARGAGRVQLDLPGGPVLAEAELRPDGRLSLLADGVRRSAAVAMTGEAVAVLCEGRDWSFTLVDPLQPRRTAGKGAGRLTAPMPGKVAQRAVEPGAAVKRGDLLLVLEAMKMEHSITAPRDGIIAAAPYRVGDLVEDGAELIVFEAEAGE